MEKEEKQELSNPTPAEEGKEEKEEPVFSPEDIEILKSYGIEANGTQDEETLKAILPNLRKKNLDATAEIKRRDSQNKEVSEKYQSLKVQAEAKARSDFERFKGLSKVDRVKEYLRVEGVDFNALPEDHLYRNDNHLDSMYPFIKDKIEAKYPEPKEEAKPSAVSEEEVKAEAEQIEKQIMDIHPDMYQVYGSAEFGNWLRSLGKMDQAKFISPDPKDHISLINQFKLISSARAESEQAEAEKKKKLKAQAGHGSINSGGISETVHPDTLQTSDWIKQRNKQVHGY